MNNVRAISATGKITLLAASTLTVMAGAIIAPSLPAMQAAFSGTENAAFLVRLLLTLPALFIVIGAPIAGFLIDRFGRKPLLIGSAVLYAAAGSSGFYLESLAAMLIGRALLGLAVGGIMTCVTTLIADYLTGEARARLLGLQGSFMSLGGVLFLILGGILADIQWHYPFLIYLFSLLLLPFMFISLFEPERQVFSQTAAPNFFGFIFSNWVLALIFALSFVGMTAFYLIPVQLPFHLAEMSGAGAKESGFAIAVSSFVAAMTAFNYRRIKHRLSYPAIYAVSFLLVGASYFIIGWAQSYAVTLIGLALNGLGNAFLLPNASSWMTAIVPENLRGRGVGALTMAFFFGQFVSPFVSQPLVARFGTGSTFVIIGAVLLLIAGFLIFVSLSKQTDVLTAPTDLSDESVS